MDEPTSLTPVLAAPALIILGLLMAAAIAWYHLVLKKRGWQPKISDIA